MGCAWLARLCCGTDIGQAAVRIEDLAEASNIPVKQLLRKEDVETEAIVGEDGLSHPWGPCRQSGTLQSKLKVPYTELTFHALIGKGSFKQVYRGKWNNTIVAIVAMRRGGLVTEARLMQQLGAHPNLVQFYRWSTDTHGNEYMVMEFMPFGSLEKILTQFGPSLRNRSKLMMCEQICNAMCELASVGMQHRDLAARNILVQSVHPIHVKVSDFGLARVAKQQQEVCFQDRKSPGVEPHHAGATDSSSNSMAVEAAIEEEEEETPLVPVRWSAPEVLQPGGGGWSEKSDVYSYGVTMWEIFSNGAEPYASRSDMEAAAAIVAGVRLHRPMNCPHQVYALMLDCWRLDPAQRPSFRQIADVYRRWRDATLAARAAAAGIDSTPGSGIADKKITTTTAPVAGISGRSSCANSTGTSIFRKTDTAVRGKAPHGPMQGAGHHTECSLAPMPLFSSSSAQLSSSQPPNITTSNHREVGHGYTCLASIVCSYTTKSASAASAAAKQLVAIPSGEILREMEHVADPPAHPVHESGRRVLSHTVLHPGAFKVLAATTAVNNEADATLPYPRTMDLRKASSSGKKTVTAMAHAHVRSKCGSSGGGDSCARAPLAKQQQAADHTSPHDSASSEATPKPGDSGSVGERSGKTSGLRRLAGLVPLAAAPASELAPTGDTGLGGASPRTLAPEGSVQGVACADGGVLSRQQQRNDNLDGPKPACLSVEVVLPEKECRQTGGGSKGLRASDSQGRVRSGGGVAGMEMVSRPVRFRGFVLRPGVRRCNTIGAVGRLRQPVVAPSPLRRVSSPGVRMVRTPVPGIAEVSCDDTGNDVPIVGDGGGPRVTVACEGGAQEGLKAHTAAHGNPAHAASGVPFGQVFGQLDNSGCSAGGSDGDGNGSMVGVRPGRGTGMHGYVSDYPSVTQHWDGSGGFRVRTAAAAGGSGGIGACANTSGGGLSTLAGCDTCLLSMEVETAIDPMMSCSTGRSLGSLRTTGREGPGVLPPGQQLQPSLLRPLGSGGGPRGPAHTGSVGGRWHATRTLELGVNLRRGSNPRPCRASWPSAVRAGSLSAVLPRSAPLPQPFARAPPAASMRAGAIQGDVNRQPTPYLERPLHGVMAPTGVCIPTFQSTPPPRAPPPTPDRHGIPVAEAIAASTFRNPFHSLGGVASVAPASAMTTVGPFHSAQLSSALGVEVPSPSAPDLPLRATAAAQVGCSASTYNPYLCIKELYC